MISWRKNEMYTWCRLYRSKFRNR